MSIENATGWEGLNNVGQPFTPEEQKQIEMQEQIMRQTARDFAYTFGTEQGKRVFAWLRAQTIERPTLPAAAMAGLDGMTVAILQNIREGENNLVRLIESQIKKGLTPNEPAE